MSGPDPAAPLVVTLVLDAETTDRFERERAQHFPAGRTAVGAHLTLFHAVPGERLGTVLGDVREQARRPAFDLAVSEVFPLGRGVAYRLESDEVLEIHARLQTAWHAVLTRQDRQRLSPHVTVQNKVQPEQARATLARLRAVFTPFTASATGLAVWRYVGGPWEPAGSFDLGT